MEGYTVKAARINRGLKQKELAEKLGVSCRSMSLWETGKVKMSKRTLLAIASALQMDADEFILPSESD